MINKNNINNGPGQKPHKTNEWFLNQKTEEQNMEKYRRKYYGGTHGANIYFFNILQPFCTTGHMRDDLDGWGFGMDDMSGCFYIEKNGVTIWATPFWEEVDGVPVYATNDDDEELGCVTFELDLTGDSRADAAGYFDKLAKFVAVHGL